MKSALIGAALVAVFAAAPIDAQAAKKRAWNPVVPPGQTGSQQQGGQAGGSSVDPLRRFTVADIQAAIDDATAHNDARHLPCWQALLPIAQQWQAPIHAPTAPGLAELAQTYFDAQTSLSQPLVPDSVLQACAATVYDLRIDFAKLAGLVGVRLVLPAIPVL
jgi:hypothetical protein